MLGLVVCEKATHTLIETSLSFGLIKHNILYQEFLDVYVTFCVQPYSICTECSQLLVSVTLAGNGQEAEHFVSFY